MKLVINKVTLENTRIGKKINNNKKSFRLANSSGIHYTCSTIYFKIRVKVDMHPHTYEHVLQEKKGKKK